MKVDNPEIWNKVKSGEVKGFSIEGYFAENIEAAKQKRDQEIIDELKDLILDYEKQESKKK